MRAEGRDHFWWMNGDHGACRMHGSLMDYPIKITHFGLSGEGREFHYDVDRDYACFRPERDVVAPPVVAMQTNAMEKANQMYEHVLAHKGADGHKRDVLLFFAGRVAFGAKLVSGGARQAVADVLKAHSDDPEYKDVVFKIGQVGNYKEMFQTSKFCLAPYGYGWGLRLTIAVMHGCVPVITQDHVWQSFEELLPYASFSVRISNADVPNIVSILRAYSQEQVDAMRLALAQHWRAFVWDPQAGGLAYNYTLAALKRR